MTYVPPIITAIPTESVFPDNVVDLLISYLPTQITQLTGVYRRPLRPNDSNYTAGAYAIDWTPGIVEIGGPGEPTDGTYLFGIETLVKYADEQAGREWSTYLAKSVRLMVYRTPGFIVPLRGLSETRSDSSVERVQLSGIRRQNFRTGSLQSQTLFLSKTEFWVQTESA